MSQSKMKMSAKEKIMLVLLTLLFIIFGVALRYSLIQSEEFEIYRTGCHNEWVYVQRECYYNETSLYVEVQKCIDSGPHYELKEIKFCEDVEVDEINISIITECPSMIICRYWDCRVMETIDKKDLTREWLDTHCKYNLEEFGDECHPTNEGSSFCPTPTKYKCGEYKVVVK